MSSALRSFKAFTNVAPVCPTIGIDPAGVNRKTLNFPCALVNFDGVFDGTAGYLQVFDLAVAPTTTVTVPLKSIRVENDGSGGPQPFPSFMPSIGPVNMQNGLYFAMSSTEAVYTAVATNFDIWGEVVEFEGVIQANTLTAVGDLVTGVDHLQVWAEAAGPKKLVEVIGTFTNGVTGISYLMMFAKDAPTDGSEKPLLTLATLTTASIGTICDAKFGRDGLDVESQDANYTRRKGCTLWLSDTPGFLTKTVLGNVLALKAYYK